MCAGTAFTDDGRAKRGYDANSERLNSADRLLSDWLRNPTQYPQPDSDTCDICPCAQTFEEGIIVRRERGTERPAKLL